MLADLNASGNSTRISRDNDPDEEVDSALREAEDALRALDDVTNSLRKVSWMYNLLGSLGSFMTFRHNGQELGLINSTVTEDKVISAGSGHRPSSARRLCPSEVCSFAVSQVV